MQMKVALMKAGKHEDKNAAPPLRVLVVAEDAMMQRLLTYLLERRGHHVHVAGDGMSALAALQADRFAVVLMALDLGVGPTGLEVIEQLRRGLPEDGQPWVIGGTASRASEVAASCRSAGVDDLLCKPFTIEVFYATLARAALALHQKKSDDQ